MTTFLHFPQYTIVFNTKKSIVHTYMHVPAILKKLSAVVIDLILIDRDWYSLDNL